MGAIDVNGVACRTPDGVELLRDVTFTVGDGHHVALIGANGAGKTTLFRTIAGEHAPTGGSVHVVGDLRVMRQLVGWREAGRTVREMLLDEPDNYLDVPGKEWLEAAVQTCPKTILLISHDRQLLAGVAERVVTLEGGTAWVHGGSFATWHDAREVRLARLDEAHRRWQEERKRMQASLVEYRRRASMGSDAFASRVRATKSKIERFEAAPPPERVRDQQVTMRLGGDRTGTRVVICQHLEPVFA